MESDDGMNTGDLEEGLEEDVSSAAVDNTGEHETIHANVWGVWLGCLFTRKQGLGYSPGADYSQAGGWTTGYPLITPGSNRGLQLTV